jgi:hypothetical protein
MQHSPSEAGHSRGAAPLRGADASQPKRGAMIYERPEAKTRTSIPLILVALVVLAIVLFFVVRWLA